MASNSNQVVTLRRGAEMFKVQVAQISVNNLRRLFTQVDPNQLWLREDSPSSGVYFPKEDGSFDLNDNETFYELIVEGPTRPTAAEPLQPSRSVLCLSTQDQRREKRLRVTDEEDLSAAESSISIGRVTGRNKGKSVRGGIDSCDSEVSKQLEEIKEILTMMLQCLTATRRDHESAT